MATQITNLIKKLKQQQQTFSVAESCTGGALAAEIVAMPGVSNVFAGGVVAYSNHAKRILLNIPKHQLEIYGAVSAPVAKAMAQNVREVLTTDFAVGITGIAGPDGGSESKPIGTVYISVVGPYFEKTKLCKFSGKRNDIQKQAREYAIDLLLEQL